MILNTKTYDIAIIGAGPAGCAAALALAKSGLKVALVDKAIFPREKVCGDAIPGPALNTLSQAFPFFAREFPKIKEQQRINSSRIMLQNGRSIDYQWKLPAYNIKREVFDSFLLRLVRIYTSAHCLEGWKVEKIIPGQPHLIQSDNQDKSISAKLIIYCSGNNSIVEKFTQHPIPYIQHKVMAVRAYYKDVKLNNTNNFFWVKKKYLPGYFWAFPLANGVYNIGFGIKTGKDGKVPVKMKDVLDEFIQSEQMKDVFSGSQQLTDASGAIIPIGGKKASYSGEGFLIAGDAAHLADPLQGHGIDKAIVSGLLAGHQARKCFQEGDFSAEFISYYDLSIKSGIERELRKNRKRMVLLSNFPSLLNLYSYFRN